MIEIAVDGFDLPVVGSSNQIESVNRVSKTLEILATARHFMATVAIRSPCQRCIL